MKSVFLLLGLMFLSTQTFAFTKMICHASAKSKRTQSSESLVPTAFRPSDILSYVDKQDQLGLPYTLFEVNPYAWNSGQPIEMSWSAKILENKLQVNLKMRHVSSGIELQINETESGQSFFGVIPFNQNFAVQRPSNGDAYFVISCNARTPSKTLSR